MEWWWRSKKTRRRSSSSPVGLLHAVAMVVVVLGVWGCSCLQATCAMTPPHIPPEVFQTPPADGALYQLLQVPFNASSRDIQRSYHRMALRLHPDKHGGDEALSREFKLVNEAYATLSTAESRARYHLYGIRPDGEGGGGEGGYYGGAMATHHQQQQHATLEHAITQHFGGGRFEHLIGTLPTNYLVVPGPDGTTVETFDYEGRVKGLAEGLCDKLQLYVTGQGSEWERLVFEEAQSLRDEPMGPQLLATLGYVYERTGRKFLKKMTRHFTGASASPSSFYGVPLSTFAGKAHQFSTYVSAMGSSMRLLYRLRTKHRNLADPQVLPSLLDALWSLNKVDIERTVKEACKRVLRDPQQPMATLEARARALVTLGRIYTATSKLPPQTQ